MCSIRILSISVDTYYEPLLWFMIGIELDKEIVINAFTKLDPLSVTVVVTFLVSP